MKKVIIFLVLGIFIISTQAVNAQTRQERKHIKAIERQIEDVESELEDLIKEYEKEGREELYRLKRSLEEARAVAYQKVRVNSAQEIEEAGKRMVKLEQQIAEFEGRPATRMIALKEEQLVNLMELRNEVILNATGREVPKEMSAYTMKKRKNSLEIQRQEMVTAKISNDINQPETSTTSNVQRKIVIHNDYHSRTDFFLTGLRGGGDYPVSLDPGDIYYLEVIPDDYLVRTSVGGVMSRHTFIMRVDGQAAHYSLPGPEGVQKFWGYVNKSRPEY